MCRVAAFRRAGPNASTITLACVADLDEGRKLFGVCGFGMHDVVETTLEPGVGRVLHDD
jgi:hypothetical protein